MPDFTEKHFFDATLPHQHPAGFAQTLVGWPEENLEPAAAIRLPRQPNAAPVPRDVFRLVNRTETQLNAYISKLFAASGFTKERQNAYNGLVELLDALRSAKVIWNEPAANNPDMVRKLWHLSLAGVDPNNYQPLAEEINALLPYSSLNEIGSHEPAATFQLHVPAVEADAGFGTDIVNELTELQNALLRHGTLTAAQKHVFEAIWNVIANEQQPADPPERPSKPSSYASIGYGAVVKKRPPLD